MPSDGPKRRRRTRDTNNVAPLLYRMPEAAHALGVSLTKAYDLVHRGVVPSVRLAGVLRVPAEGLKNTLRRMEQKNQQE